MRYHANICGKPQPAKENNGIEGERMRCEVLSSFKAEYVDNLKSQVFRAHRERINNENRMSVIILLSFTFIILAVNLIIQAVMQRAMTAQLIELAVYGILGVASYTLIRRGTANYTLMMYLLELPLLLVSLISGTVFQPGNLTFSFLFFLLVLPSLILDNPKHVVAFIWILGIAFAFIDVSVKDPSLVSRDLQHCLNICMISTAECLCLLSTRIKNIDFAADFKEQTLHDPLTGLYNRVGAERYADTHKAGAFLFIDLDNFKQINDTFGHAEGDQVLRQVADVLRHAFRESDVTVRLGGDEFAVFAQGSWNDSDLDKRLDDTLHQLEQIVVSRDDVRIAMTASIGCIVETNGCDSFDEMLRLADHEMYEVKTHGKDNYHMERVS